MKERAEKKKGSLVPKTNMAVNYYIDPVYSANGLYGLENESENESEPEDETKKSEIDEPIESWGWINNFPEGRTDIRLSAIRVRGSGE